MAFVFLLVLVLFFICLHIFIRYSEYGRTMDQIPGPPALPFFGNILLFNTSLEETWLSVRRLQKEYYPIFRLWRVTNASVMTCHADDVKTIFTCKKNIAKTTEIKNTEFRGNSGIISSDGTLWYHRRRIINQAFTPELLEHYSKTAIKHAEKFVSELRGQSRDFLLNTPPEFLKLALNITLEATMGFDLDKIKPEEEVKFKNAFSELNALVTWRIFRPYITNWMLKFLPLGRHQLKIGNDVYNIAEKILNERIACREQYEHNILENSVDNPKRDRTFEGIKEKEQLLFISDVLLQAEEKGLIDRGGIFHETSTLLLAGFETTGTQMCFILALLAENKRAQDLVRAEILETLDAGEKRITANSVKKMQYLDRCVKESMRLFPAVPHIGRAITDSIELGKYKVLPGTEVYINIYDLHRDPKFWPEPDTFNPDRFLPENIQLRHKFSFVPFGGGLRNCIGQKLAMIQMKTLTAYIIHNFILEPADLIADQKLKIKITLAPDKYSLKFIRIDH